MYQLYYGISLYEAEVERAKDEQARRESTKPEDMYSIARLSSTPRARRWSARASWRRRCGGSLLLGRVYRDLDDRGAPSSSARRSASTRPITTAISR